MSKCFCHLVDRTTGEEYEVKDSTARRIADEVDTKVTTLESNMMGTDFDVKDLQKRVEDLEAGGTGGTGGSGGSVKLYRHDIYASLSSSSNLSSLGINYTVYTKSETPYTANTFMDLLYTIPEGNSVSVTGTGYTNYSELIIPYRLSYIHEYDDYYTLCLHYVYCSNGSMQESTEYGIWFTYVSDTVTEIK